MPASSPRAEPARRLGDERWVPWRSRNKRERWAGKGGHAEGEEESWRQRWRLAVSEDRPLNHRTEFHLAFGLLSAESTTYLPVDLALLRLGPPSVPGLPLFVIVAPRPPRWGLFLSLCLS